MMGPDYTHWHGMYEVSKHYYTEFLPAVIEAAADNSKTGSLPRNAQRRKASNVFGGA